jgi:putative addiction module killer protein
MIEVQESETYTKWIDRLRDVRAVARISARLVRLSLGNFGDVRSVGEGVSELRVH